jgi:hypothetical protein
MFGVNADRLTPEQRKRLKLLLARHRDGDGLVLKHIRAKGWYTDDAPFNSLVGAQAALHAAVNSLPRDPKAPLAPSDARVP